MFLNKACHDFEKSVTPPPPNFECTCLLVRYFTLQDSIECNKHFAILKKISF